MSENANTPSTGGEPSVASSSASEAPSSTAAPPASDGGQRSTSSAARSIDPDGYPQAMLDASEDLRQQFPAAAGGENRQEPQEEEETTQTLREHLAQLEKQRATPEAELNYTYGGVTETRVHSQVDSDNEALIKETQEKIARLEKERRRELFMERARDSGPDEEQDQEPGQT